MERNQGQEETGLVNEDHRESHIWESHSEVVFGREVVRYASDTVFGNLAIGAASVVRPREAFAIARDFARAIRPHR